MNAGTIYWNSLDLGLLGKPKMKISRQPDPPAPALPTRMLVEVAVTVELDAWDPGTIMARAEHLAASMRVTEGILKVESHLGAAYEWLAVPGQNNLADVISGQANRIEMGFSSVENHATLGGFTAAVFVPISGMPITLHAVRDFKEEIRTSRHSERNGARSLTVTTISFTARVAQANAADAASARLAYLQAQANAIRGLNVREGTLTYGDFAPGLVKVQDFSPMIDERRGTLDVSVQCQHYAMPAAGTAECTYETESQMEEENPHQVITIRGDISAQTRAIADNKMLALLNEEKEKAGQRVIGYSKTDKIIDGYDTSLGSSTWPGEMTYAIQVLKRREDFKIVEKSTAKNETSGEERISISGEIMATTRELAESKLTEYLDDLNSTAGQRVASYTPKDKTVDGTSIHGTSGFSEWLGTLSFTVEVVRRRTEFKIVETNVALDEANGEQVISLKGEIMAVDLTTAKERLEIYLAEVAAVEGQRVATHSSAETQVDGTSILGESDYSEWVSTLSFTIEVRKKREDFRIAEKTRSMNEASGEEMISIRGEIMATTREAAQTKLDAYLAALNAEENQRVTAHSSTEKTVDGKNILGIDAPAEWVGTLGFTVEAVRRRTEFKIVETSVAMDETSGEQVISIKGEIMAVDLATAKARLSNYLTDISSVEGQRVVAHSSAAKQADGTSILNESGYSEWLGTLGFTIEVRKRRDDFKIVERSSSKNETSGEESISIRGEIMAGTRDQASTKLNDYLAELKEEEGSRIKSFGSTDKHVDGTNILGESSSSEWLGTLSFTVEMVRRRADFKIVETNVAMDETNGEQVISLKGEIMATSLDAAKDKLDTYLSEVNEVEGQRVASHSSAETQVNGTSILGESDYSEWVSALSFTVEVRKKREDFRIAEKTKTLNEASGEEVTSVRGEIMATTREGAQAKLDAYLEELNTEENQRVTAHSATEKTVDGKDILGIDDTAEWVGTLSFTVEAVRRRTDFKIAETNVAMDEASGEQAISIKGEITAVDLETAKSRLESYLTEINAVEGQRVTSQSSAAKQADGTSILGESGYSKWLGTLSFTVEVRKRREDFKIVDRSSSKDENNGEETISIRGEIMATTRDLATTKLNTYLAELKEEEGMRITSLSSSDKHVDGTSILGEVNFSAWLGTLGFTVEIKRKRELFSYETSVALENGNGEEVISLRGEISAEDRETAETRFTTLLQAEISKTNQRVATYSTSIKQLEGTSVLGDEITTPEWTGTLSFQIEIRKRRPQGQMTRRFSTQRDARGITKWNYSGTIWANTINDAKDLFASIQNDAESKHPLMTRSEETIDDVTIINDSGTFWFIKLDYVMEFEGAESGVIRGEINTEQTRPMTGEWRTAISGYLIAEDKADAISELDDILDEPPFEKEKLVDNTRKWTEVYLADGGTKSRTFMRLDFTASTRDARSEAAAEYTHAIQESMSTMRQTHNISGSIWSDTEDNARMALTQLITAISSDTEGLEGKKVQELSTTVHIVEKGTAAASLTGEKFYLKLDFSASWMIPLTGEVGYDLLEASMTISRDGSINQAVITPIPYDRPVAQKDTGWIPGRLQITASAKAVTFSTAKEWVQARRSIAEQFGADGTTRFETDQPRESTTPDLTPMNDDPTVILWNFSGNYGWTFIGTEMDGVWDLEITMPTP